MLSSSCIQANDKHTCMHSAILGHPCHNIMPCKCLGYCGLRISQLKCHGCSYQRCKKSLLCLWSHGSLSWKTEAYLSMTFLDMCENWSLSYIHCCINLNYFSALAIGNCGFTFSCRAAGNSLEYFTSLFFV